MNDTDPALTKPSIAPIKHIRLVSDDNTRAHCYLVTKDTGVVYTTLSGTSYHRAHPDRWDKPAPIRRVSHKAHATRTPTRRQMVRNVRRSKYILAQNL